MPFKTVFDDITKYEGDVIINSLGIKGNEYGKLCRNIIKHADDKELTNYINSLVSEMGTIYVTDAGKLPVQKIIHVVTPFKKYDPDLVLLTKAYEEAIAIAREYGLTKIGIPFIGTGANGYSDSEAYECAMKAIGSILVEEEKLDQDILDMTLVAYLKPYNQLKQTKAYEREYLLNNRVRYEDSLVESFELIMAYQMPNPISYDYLKIMSEFNPNDIVYPQFKYRFPYDFVLDYMNQHNIEDTILNSKGLDRRIKSKYANGQMKLSKLEVFRMSFICRMTKTATLQLLVLCGYSLSPFNKLDQVFYDYLKGKFKRVHRMYDIDQVFEKNGITDMHFSYY